MRVCVRMFVCVYVYIKNVCIHKRVYVYIKNVP